VDKQICAQTNLIVVPALATDEEMSVKLRKAKEKGIEIWTESEWREKLRKN
jgi:NAD-dependent DNA ligase